MKIDREAIHKKYNGRCAYCGKVITLKEMQVDHIVPIRSLPNLPEYRKDHQNLNPSCRSCNHYKRALSLEQFREIWLGGLRKRLEKLYTVKVAIDYGIVILREWDKKFYFEKISADRVERTSY